MPDAEQRYIRNRKNLPTDLTSKAISRNIPAQIRARSFFSARVAEAHILNRFRNIIDQYMTGKIGRDEARNLMLEYARANGRDDGTRAITNLASTARLNLIIDQNAAMAAAVGQYEHMYSPSNKKVFPYVIYRASVGSHKPRPEHQKYDGHIFSKDDPWLKSHWPPWDFGCHCQLENCTEKKANKTPDLIHDPEEVSNDAPKSGYSFDPSHAMGEFDLTSIKTPEQRGSIREDSEIEYGSQISFPNNPDQEDFKAKFEAKNFHTFKEEKLKPASEWRNESLPAVPQRIDPETARGILSEGKKILSKTGDEVVFDDYCLYHWKVEEAKEEKDIEDRLAWLPMAIETVTDPLEVWDQGTQQGFIKAFQKSTGGFRGCLVFVLENMKVKSYFLKDLNALDKARKGFSVKKYG